MGTRRNTDSADRREFLRADFERMYDKLQFVAWRSPCTARATNFSLLYIFPFTNLKFALIQKMEVVHGGYPLRPEIVESTYYLYQYTNDEKYLRMGKTFFEDFVRHCKNETGYAALKSVVTKEKVDSMQSFLFAGTFKYYYLLFAPPKTLDFKKIVFNTEAHPIRKTWK